MISVICPMLNEEDYVDRLLRFLDAASPEDKEIFMVDGGSTDKTMDVVREYAKRDSRIHLLNNPGRFVPMAMNIAIPNCVGEIIVRLDAHCEYAPDYFEKILEVFEKTNADIVGGPTRTAYRTEFQRAVGYCISSIFGVGNGTVHRFDFEGETDSVTFGAWKRQLFDETGLFDTRLKRNQDDEFHYRAKSLGKKIYQSPSIKLYYYPRSSLTSLFSQYFEYGLYKPLVLRKVSSEIKIRHLVPTLFLLYLVSLPFLVFITPLSLLFPLVYLIILISCAVLSPLPLRAKMASILIFPTLHISYGFGFLKGLLFPPK